MSDPVRWRDPGGGAPSEARDLLRHARAPRPLEAAARARNAAAVAKIAAAPVVAPAVALGAKVLLGVGLASALGVVAASGASRARPAPPHRQAAVVHTAQVPPNTPQPAVDATPSPELRATPATPAATPAATPTRPLAAAPVAHAQPHAAPDTHAPRPAETLPAQVAATAAPLVAGPDLPGVPHVIPSRGAAPAAAATSAPDDTLALENPLVTEASALVDADPRAALAVLDRHAREFPRGQMAVDREFLAVRALRNLGRNAEARARGEALLARFPWSPYTARVRRLLDALP